MSPAVKLAAFAALLGVVFVLGAGLGAAFGPSTGDDEPPPHGGHSYGYALAPESSTLGAGTQAFRFRVTDPDGSVVTDYEVEHDKELHLIVVSTDLASFQHVHPARDSAGWWSVELTDLRSGDYRAYADFTVHRGPSLVLEHELTVPGTPSAPAHHEPSSVAVVDGLRVELDAGTVRVGESTAVLRVTLDGQPAPLETHLGAGGHLVAISADDLAYLHVHPQSADEERGEVTFGLDIPEAGLHRLFFDFQVGGVVRTAAFTVDVAESSTPSDGSDQGHGH